MLAAASKNPITLDARVWSQICIKVNISTGLPCEAEKDTVLHETTHRQLLWDSLLAVQGRKRQGLLRCSSSQHGKALGQEALSCSEHNPPSKIILKGQDNKQEVERRAMPFKCVTEGMQYKRVHAAQLHFFFFFISSAPYAQLLETKKRGERGHGMRLFLQSFFSLHQAERRGSYASTGTSRMNAQVALSRRMYYFCTLEGSWRHNTISCF